MPIQLSVAQQFRLQELAGLTMRLRDVLVTLGFDDAAIDKLVKDKEVQSLYRQGKREGEEKIVRAVKQEALSGNVSAARLLVNRKDDGDDASAPLDQTQKARMRIMFQEVGESVRAGFRQQKTYVLESIRRAREAGNT
jgi:hypothetical protein